MVVGKAIHPLLHCGKWSLKLQCETNDTLHSMNVINIYSMSISLRTGKSNTMQDRFKKKFFFCTYIIVSTQILSFQVL